MLDFRTVDWETEAARGCDGKTPMASRIARLVAAEARAEGTPLMPYRCPWCHWWHVGHVPSMEGLERIAAAIRNRQENP